MTVRERMLALSLMEKAEKNPELAKKIGIAVSFQEGQQRKIKSEDNKD